MSGRAFRARNQIEKLIQVGGDILEDQLIEAAKNKKTYMKEVNRKAAVKRAKGLGLSPTSNLGFMLRSKLNQRIIDEVKLRRLTHAEVAQISLTSRTRITAIMNFNLKKVSTDHMFRILEILGIDVEIRFKPNK